MQLSGVAACRLGVLPHTFDLGLRLVRGDAHAEPTVAHFTHPLECRPGLAAKDNRRIRLLQRLRVRADLWKTAELALKFRLFFSPQPLHRLEIFSRALRAPLPRYADSSEFLGEPADADTEVKAAAGELVQARHLFR